MHILNIICQDNWMPKHLSQGWRNIGATVEDFFYGGIMGKPSWTAEGLKHNHIINEQLFSKAKELKSQGKLDLIFAVIYDDVLEIETAKKLRSLDVPMVNYHVDLVGQWYRILRTGKYFDRVACAQRDHWSALCRAGIKPYYMPMGAIPLPDNQPLLNNSFSFDGVLFLGSPWPYRPTILAGLQEQSIPLQIYGQNWPDVKNEEKSKRPIQTLPRKSGLQQYINALKSSNTRKNIHDLRYYLCPCLQEQGWSDVWQKLKKSSTSYSASEMSCITKLSKSFKGFYSESDFYSLVQGAAINLGFTHFQGNKGANSKLRQVRLRDFEIPMAGGFYLTQDCDQIHELFKVGDHLDTWNELPDLLEKVSYYLDHPSETKKMAAAGKNHCLKYHTWEVRFRDLLKELD